MGSRGLSRGRGGIGGGLGLNGRIRRCGGGMRGLFGGFGRLMALLGGFAGGLCLLLGLVLLLLACSICVGLPRLLGGFCIGGFGGRSRGVFVHLLFGWV
jgi:hypothetical protein